MYRKVSNKVQGESFKFSDFMNSSPVLLTLFPDEDSLMRSWGPQIGANWGQMYCRKPLQCSNC